MRRSAALILLLVVVLTACGGGEGVPGDRIAEGAFAGAADCDELVQQTIDARQRVLVDLGDARRTDTARIDEALTSFGGDGPDLAVRYQDLGCDQSFDEAVCAAAPTLTSEGPAGRDLVATWTSSCP